MNIRVIHKFMRKVSNRVITGIELQKASCGEVQMSN